MRGIMSLSEGLERKVSAIERVFLLFSLVHGNASLLSACPHFSYDYFNFFHFSQIFDPKLFILSILSHHLQRKQNPSLVEPFLFPSNYSQVNIFIDPKLSSATPFTSKFLGRDVYTAVMNYLPFTSLATIIWFSVS